MQVESYDQALKEWSKFRKGILERRTRGAVLTFRQFVETYWETMTKGLKASGVDADRYRLDAIIPFGALPSEIVAMVVDKFIIQLEAQLTDRGVSIELDAEARAWLARKGYDPMFGARPLGRVIQEHIKKPLAEELLFGKLARGGTVLVTIRGGKPAFRYPDAPLDDGEHRRGGKVPEMAS